jgi:hypothetical protein
VTVKCGDSTEPGEGQQGNGSATAFDNCDEEPLVDYADSFVPGCGLSGVIIRTWTATDQCGNSSDCTQRITLEDTTAPEIMCPDPVTIECGDDLPTTLATATDVCDDNVSLTYSDDALTDNLLCQWLILRTHYATDACGNVSSCVQEILIVDTTPPVISCPADVTLECGDPLPVDLATATDLCDDAPFVTLIDVDTIGQGCSYTVIRTFRAQDACGNSSSCTQVVTFEDTTAPEIACPEDVDVPCLEKTCLTFEEFEVGADGPLIEVTSITEGGVTATFSGKSKGNVPRAIAIFNSADPHPGCDDLGTPSELYGGPGISTTAPDGAPSNNQALGNVIVIQNPNALFPDDYFLSDTITVEFDKPVFFESFINLDFELEQIMDGAGVFIYQDGNAVPTFIGYSLALGNDNSMEQIEVVMGEVVKVKFYYGTTVPTSGAIANICYHYIPKDDAAVSDACGNETSVHCNEFTRYVDECTSEIIRTYSASDVCGNVSGSCTQTITLHTDGLQPEIICPADITIGCDDEVPAPDPDAVVATDNCTEMGDIFVTWVQDIYEGEGCEEVIRRIYLAVGGCGNEALCVQYITREPIQLQVQIMAQVFLQAAMNGGGDGMEARLNDMGYMPNQQPYTMAPYDYWGAEDCVEMPEDVVDWVLMQLRDVTTMEVVASRAALVKENGEIVDLDGVSPVTFDAPADWYYIALCHRNHLDIITPAPMDCTDGEGGCDFRTDMGDNPEGMVEVSLGMFAMIQGDVNGDNLVKYNGSNNDKNAILIHVGIQTPNNILSGYNRYDVNMDGLVKYNGSNNDKNAILNVVGLTTPNNIVNGQMQ